jgi:hypothetical protein
MTVLTRAPEAPEMVSVLVPAPAVLLAVTVRVLVLLVEVGEKVAVTPLGAPDSDRFTAPVNPYCGVTVIVDVAELPWFNPRLVGEVERRKLGA